MNRSSKYNVLFLLHLPPPVHGSSMMGSYIKISTSINENFTCEYINLMAAKHVKESGKVNLNKVVGFIRVWGKLLVKLLNNKPDLCYLALTSSGSGFLRDVLLVFLLRIFNIKRVYHLHNKGIATSGTNLIKRFLYRFAFKDANVIILSKYLYHDIKSYVPESNVFICPNGIPNKFNKPSFFKRDSSKVKILFLSNLIKSKGVLDLIEACRILKDKGYIYECDFVGAEGDINASQFQNLKNQYGLQNHINYLGKKYGKEKETIFNEVDIFAFPTYYPYECFPLVLLEAMQNGLPVISTFEGGIPDIIDDGETGFIIPQKNFRSLAEKLELLILDQNLRKRFGEAGLKKFKKEFTIEKFETRMVEILVNSI